MAIYVTSDAHGHLRALDRALELAAPGPDDTLYVLGDMVDRGPEPVGVLQLVRGIPGVRVLMGNHERMMLDALLHDSDIDLGTWALNGGYATAPGLDSLPREEFSDLIDWIANLPLYDVVETPERAFILAHAGIDALAARGYLATAGVDCSEGRGAGDATREQLMDMMSQQDPQDLLWIRERFWAESTGLVGADGTGPVVVAGHTPSTALGFYAQAGEGVGVTEDGRGVVTPLGACEATGGVADRIDIDCAAAGGADMGRVGVLRLDDGATWYAEVKPGE
ncbi:metallophosphoesterase [Collinsella sp. An2]|uniref:metallophosphoesterase n=1 Tax=Collinsella sp. An2 TaxID=1965585 RepID=UPI000B39589A|nr:metallophosphoesterase [Collinsella sp. An2]OUP08438.1 serine/threonine protein phosphatase [Collinsella sp. An2]